MKNGSRRKKKELSQIVGARVEDQTSWRALMVPGTAPARFLNGGRLTHAPWVGAAVPFMKLQ